MLNSPCKHKINFKGTALLRTVSVERSASYGSHFSLYRFDHLVKQLGAKLLSDLVKARFSIRPERPLSRQNACLSEPTLPCERDGWHTVEF